MSSPGLEVSAIDKALILVALAQVAVFCCFWFDKHQARSHGWRVRESTLLLVSLAGGIGAWLGQHILRHKTQKEPFRTLLGVAIGVHLVGLAGLFYVLLG